MDFAPNAQHEFKPSQLAVNTDPRQRQGYDTSPIKNDGSQGGSVNQNGFTPNKQYEMMPEIVEPNWWEFRFKGKQPDRRGYHSSFIFDKKLYVFGGKDIGIGQLKSLWCIDLSELDDFVPGESEFSLNPEWYELNTTGTRPPAISHHTSLVYQNKMFLFGGSTRDQENTNFYQLDLTKNQWQVVKAKALHGDQTNFPKTRDEHSCVLQDNAMIIFGGFAFGERTNEIYRFSFIDNTWEKIIPHSEVVPCPRAGHSAVVRMNPAQGDCMYIFGGKDDDNNKMSDTWKFNFKTQIWTELKFDSDQSPIARSGHAAQIYKEFMIIYGGIYEVTKELNDMHVFDLKNEKWLCLFEELNSPQKPLQGSISPGLTGTNRKQTLKNTNNLDSPRKEMKSSIKNSSAAKKRFPLPPGTASGKRKARLQLSKLSSLQETERVIKLESPTSITMKNSFLIKNADPSFEKSYNQIKKKSQEKEKAGYIPNDYDENRSKTSGKRPPARDGHTGLLVGDNFFVFGGDRHHMPFNDFHMLDVRSEFTAKSYIF